MTFCFVAQKWYGIFWMEVKVHRHFISDITFIKILLKYKHLNKSTSVTMPSLFLSKAFMKKSEDLRILMKLSFVRFPSSPASRITLSNFFFGLSNVSQNVQNGSYGWSLIRIWMINLVDHYVDEDDQSFMLIAWFNQDKIFGTYYNFQIS